MTTYIDIAREYFPTDYNDELLGFILWNETAFPFCDEPTLRHQFAAVRLALDTADREGRTLPLGDGTALIEGLALVARRNDEQTDRP
jgi:hypothetical protein